jgi:Cu+-exporting ATPase
LGTHVDRTNESEVNAMAYDPVCKMEVDPEKAAAKAEYEGETYYFCAPGCKTAFIKDPERYLGEGMGHEAHGHQQHSCCQ